MHFHHTRRCCNESHVSEAPNDPESLRASPITLYHYIALGLWVRPVSLGPGVVVWPAHEVESIIEARMRGASDAGIKEIVEKLHAARLSNSAPCAA